MEAEFDRPDKDQSGGSRCQGPKRIKITCKPLHKCGSSAGSLRLEEAEICGGAGTQDNTRASIGQRKDKGITARPIVVVWPFLCQPE
jgi:hypothetical protein